MNYETFKSVVREREPKPYDLGHGVRKAQRTLHHEEIKATRRLMENITYGVPKCYRDPRFTKSAEEWIGLPEETPDGQKKNGESTKVDQVIFRTLRRIQNQRSGFKPHLHRDQYVRPDNLPKLLDRMITICCDPLGVAISDWVAHMDWEVGRDWKIRTKKERLGMRGEDHLATRPAARPRKRRRA